MKSVIVKSAASVILAACSFTASALPVVTTAPADSQLPVVIETDSDVPAASKLMTSGPVIAPKIQVKPVTQENPKATTRLWVGSMAGVVGASGMDAASSWGKVEGNAFLKSANGTFGAKGLMLKGGLASATLVPQVLMRNNKKMHKTFAIANLIQTSVFSGIAIRNLGIPAPR